MASTTPAGLQSTRVLARRRIFVAGLNVATYLGLAWAMVEVLAVGGWSLIDALMLLCFLFAAPWSVLGFWNAAIGLWLLHVSPDAMEETAPFDAAGDDPAPLHVRTAVLLTIRNEDPDRAMARLRIVKDSVDATGEGAHFGWFVLSDTSDPELAAAEENAFAALRDAFDDPHRLHYRRRDRNTGFKAGNLRDFCERWGGEYELMLPLDADSLMDGTTVVRLARIMQAHPRIGILQSLVVGLPSRSAFARLFQFGMRQGMRPYTMGSAWWAGECGPFWGHNGMVRIAPFASQCHLPTIPGGPPLGGPILSHDQVEAALMRRAGYEVRVLPRECGSWEENPPTVVEFTRRDLRWCQGNMQYFRLLGLPGLAPMSRFQLAWAILMFLGIPAWTLMFALAALKPFDAADLQAGYRSGLALAVYLSFILMYLAPKIAGALDVTLTRGGVARYGGGVRFAAGVAAELAFSFMVGAATTLRTTLFMLGLLVGRSVVWNGQARDAHALSWATAARGLWPQTLFGSVVMSLLWWNAPVAFWWGLPLLAGFPLSIPFAVVTASPAFGRWLAHIGLCAIPEEIDPPPEVMALERPAPASVLVRAA
ncbi:glucans biosynthesis glucosyltransferase MdoH [Alsobacter sp. SYSU M60028]|uniref:Glucans biosynthesis glucosyltransferase H n=1 Tax=Alsobacter ponti TaxID=2962936 RepID=A0ABT1LBF1_9HYPH|nr:glucans biosynthesis glucosyltransferase MdoH [Alsobacter ponti]MCP8938383.1 glucans biosynthesis glucosyltransferase MdoH [Alsobacter ponti]